MRTCPPRTQAPVKDTVADGRKALCESLGTEIRQGVPSLRGNDGASLDKAADSRCKGDLVLTVKVVGKPVVKRVLARCTCGWTAYRWLLN